MNEIFLAVVERNLPRVMSYERDGRWRDVSAHELYTRVLHTARQLQQWGIRKGDRVALIAENRMEWAITDWACLCLGIVDVPIYPTLLADQTGFILKNSGARAVFVSTQKQLEKVLVAKQGTAVEQIVVMDDVDHSGAARMSTIMAPEQPGERDKNFEAIVRSIVPQDLATIIYTSGTTGIPKGVMLTHENLTSNLTQTSVSLHWKPEHISLSFLPLSHVTARHVDYLCVLHGVTLAYCPAFDQLPRMLQEVHPHLFVSVPRVYEKVRQETERKTSTGVKNRIYRWAMRVGRAHRDEILRCEVPTSWQWKLANLLVFRKISEFFGGRVLMYLSGGAPLGLDLAQWFADIGILILEGYGLTETSPVIAVNEVEQHKLGTVGKPLGNIECRIAADGELLVRGPSIFKGYWNNPEETAKAFEGDWFKTGDIGSIDADGYLSITDRKKDLLKTSGGKFIAPQPIENRLKASPLVGYPVVIGDQRKFASVVISPNFPALEHWAQERSIPLQSRAELILRPEVVALYEQIVADLNTDLAHFETLKKVLLVPDEFTVDTGEITPTLKLRRRTIEQKYRAQIDALYATSAPVSEPAKA
ncbi:MAG TPA: long-chain fatty acid--CoA ligase [Terriglobales bacterium]|nr:long-chain fatty acid--CoA ligase [Terriglobales bacterium]